MVAGADQQSNSGSGWFGAGFPFGVTTELEMQGHWTFKARGKIAERDDVADVRSSGMGVTPPGGHPSQYLKSGNLLMRLLFRFPFVSSPDEAVRFVGVQIANGADYVKVFIEDGTTVGFPGLRMITDETLFAAVGEAHRLGKMAIAHVTTFEGGVRAISAGVDGLAHLLLVKGDPTTNIADTLSIQAVWRRGVMLKPASRCARWPC
jgi:imidazolonepropionase-like amidohydrolase